MFLDKYEKIFSAKITKSKQHFLFYAKSAFYKDFDFAFIAMKSIMIETALQ